MDSEAGRSIPSYNVNDDCVVDLTLKLGLPYEDNNQSHLRQQVYHNPTVSDPANFNFRGPYTANLQQEAPNNYGIVSGGGQANTNLNHGMAGGGRPSSMNLNYGIANHGGDSVMANTESNPNGGQNYNLDGSQIGWLPQNYMNSSNHQYGAGEAVVGIPIGTPAYFNAPMPSMNNYTLQQNDPRNVGVEIQNDSRRRVGSYNDATKRCTNYHCNTNDTPMWRKGPLGPKTLCNACGIKYRKEVEKRRAKEAAVSSSKG